MKRLGPKIKTPQIIEAEIPEKDSPEYQDEFRVGQMVDGVQICGANQDGVPCSNTNLAENGRCVRHGAKVPVGIGHYNYKNGMMSRYERYRIPAKLYEAYQRAKDDPDYLDNTEELALLSGQINELNRQLGDTEDPLLQRSLRKEIREVIRLRAQLTETQLKHQAHMDSHITYIEAIAMAKELQQITRSLAFDYFKEDARRFLEELESKWTGILFGAR